MALEKRLIDAHVFHGRDGLVRDPGKHPVHQQKGVAVGQQALNVRDAKACIRGGSHGHVLQGREFGQQMVELEHEPDGGIANLRRRVQ